MATQEITVEIKGDSGQTAAYAYKRTGGNGTGDATSVATAEGPAGTGTYIVTIQWDDANPSNKPIGEWMVGVGTQTVSYGESAVVFDPTETWYPIGSLTKAQAQAAILDRVLPGNHDTADSVGVFLQKLDAAISTRNATAPATPANVTDARDAVITEVDANETKIDALTTTVGAAGAGLTEAGGDGNQYTAIPSMATPANIRTELATELARLDENVSAPKTLTTGERTSIAAAVRVDLAVELARLDENVSASKTLTTSERAAVAAAVRVDLTVELARLDENVSASKTLTAGTIASIAASVEAAILDEGDATPLLAAVAAKVEEFLINDGDVTATMAAIATAVRTNLAVELAMLDVAISTRNAVAPATPGDVTASESSVLAAVAASESKIDVLTTTVGAAGVGLTEAGGTGDQFTVVLDAISGIDVTFPAAAQASIDKMEAIVSNKMVVDKADGKLKIFDTDGTTVLFEAPVYEDSAGLTAYRGKGLERREAIAAP